MKRLIIFIIAMGLIAAAVFYAYNLPSTQVTLAAEPPRHKFMITRPEHADLVGYCVFESVRSEYSMGMAKGATQSQIEEKYTKICNCTVQEIEKSPGVDEIFKAVRKEKSFFYVMQDKVNPKIKTFVIDTYRSCAASIFK